MTEKSDEEMDRKVTDAIVDVFYAIHGLLIGLTGLCESGSEYLDAKTRERFSSQNLPPMRFSNISKHKLIPPKKG